MKQLISINRMILKMVIDGEYIKATQLLGTVVKLYVFIPVTVFNLTCSILRKYDPNRFDKFFSIMKKQKTLANNPVHVHFPFIVLFSFFPALFLFTVVNHWNVYFVCMFFLTLNTPTFLFISSRLTDSTVP